MQSTSELSTRAPISTVPYDVLSEIFAHCLPQYPLKEQQPNTKIAPMLLCHICSSWRSTALAWPTLWRNLCFCLTISRKEGLQGIPHAFVESEINFIRWWRKNQGSMAPFLSLSVIYSIREMSQQAEEDSAGTMEFLIEYIISAEYLRLHRFFWSRLHERCAGSIGSGNIHYSGEAFELTDALPALRRLSINGGIMVSKLTNSIPLTHVSLDYISLPTSVWFSFIRALPNLQCGYFNIRYINDRTRYTKPPACTLLRLSTLCMGFCPSKEYSARFSFHTLFANLHLPSLHTLLLSWPPSEERYSSGSDSTVALYAALKSTPAVTTLVLAERFLGLASPDSSQAGSIGPIWHNLPHLLELQLVVYQGGSYPRFKRSKNEVEAELEVYVRDIMFAEGNWLDLRNLACPIRAITIVDMASSPTSYFVGEFTMARIRRHADQLPHVVFKLASETAAHLAVDALHD